MRNSKWLANYYPCDLFALVNIVVNELRELGILRPLGLSLPYSSDTWKLPSLVFVVGSDKYNIHLLRHSCRFWKQLGGRSLMAVQLSSVGFSQPNSRLKTIIYGRWRSNWGQICLTEVDPSVTHVVSTDTGTEKSRWALQEEKFLVHPGWIEAANYFWQKQPEDKFPVNKTESQWFISWELNRSLVAMPFLPLFHCILLFMLTCFWEFLWLHWCG